MGIGFLPAPIMVLDPLSHLLFYKVKAINNGDCRPPTFSERTVVQVSPKVLHKVAKTEPFLGHEFIKNEQAPVDLLPSCAVKPFRILEKPGKLLVIILFVKVIAHVYSGIHKYLCHYPGAAAAKSANTKYFFFQWFYNFKNRMKFQEFKDSNAFLTFAAYKIGQ